MKDEQVRNFFVNKQLTEEEQKYLDYHLKRLSFTTSLVEQFTQMHNTQNILDIGPHFLTYCLAQMLKPKIKISTLGFSNERLCPSDLIENHFEINLNECSSSLLPASQANFDLIVFSETIEHLCTSPKTILSFFSGLLKKERGAGILIQTPNAVSLPKRIRMLLGNNPFELIREDKTNPGHIREYTMKELENYAYDTGFEILSKKYCSFWIGNSLTKMMINLVPSFRDGITLLLVRK